MKKTVVAIILALTFTLAAVSLGQLTYDSVRVRVEAATTCPVDWTKQTESVTSPALFYIRAPASIGGRSFLVSEALVDDLWDTAAKRTAAVSAGTLEIQASTTADRHYCALLP